MKRAYRSIIYQKPSDRLFFGIRFLGSIPHVFMQDDPQDWEQESAKMADVYSGSY
jgi:hypothetical protein